MAWRNLAFDLLFFLLVAGLVHGRANFTQCRLAFINNETNIALYRYRGPNYHYSVDDGDGRVPPISVPGCQALCGTGSDWYSWEAIATTMTTWVLPISGLLIQAPYESNARRRNIFALIRWIGSPMASLFYILLNIKVAAKCALIVDMAVDYRDLPSSTSPFAEIRDSFYILSVMNQYRVQPKINGIAGAKLLRLALFSDDSAVLAGGTTLGQLRQELASNLREVRRRGVVPLYISLGWFVFSLILSLQAAFGNLGSNTQAHDLALGLLLGWVPVLIFTSIIDRNPIAVDDVRRRLNHLVDCVRQSFLETPQRQHFFDHDDYGTQYYSWIHDIRKDARFSEFFTEFAGQGRSRMHYGVGAPILTAIEFSEFSESEDIGQLGRNWLHDTAAARRTLAYGSIDPRGLFSFDTREIWQLFFSFLIIGGSVSGAFIISYLTPTAGLGCRSGGYMVFLVASTSLLFLELFIWYLTSRESSTRKNAERVLNILEAVSAGWLCYIILAQTVGLYRSCNCVASTWAGLGGYINLVTEKYYDGRNVKFYWSLGTAVGCTVMGAGLAFVIAEWCEHSHLNTLSYEHAMRGLRRTRRWKRFTLYFRHVPDRIIEVVKWIIRRKGRRSMVWTRKSRPVERRWLMKELTP